MRTAWVALVVGLALTAGFSSGHLSTDGLKTIVLSAGGSDRRETVVEFALPPDVTGGSLQLRDESGRVVPLQVDRDRQAWFVLETAPARTDLRYTLEPALDRSPSSDYVQVLREEQRLVARVGGELALAYQAEAGELPSPDIKPIFRRGGYIHPIFTPSGRLVSDDYPPNHLHHHGIWSAWTKTEFDGRTPDFWNMGSGTGTVEFESLERSWSGPVHGGVVAHHRFIDLGASPAVTALTERWTVRVYPEGRHPRPYRVFDLESVQRTATGQPLVLPEYHYGGIGFRGHRQWDGAENTFFLTSEGKDRRDGHATRARWCHIGGRVDGELAGVAILGHPGNVRAPQPMRIHPTEPFFNWAPTQLGRMAIEPGQPYVSRYRFIVHDGVPDVAFIERLWRDYADPPRVTWR
jgi:hypothetical protein